MKAITKYSKWVLASAVILSAPVFTACSDDDDEPVVHVPENFEMNLASLNISWDETEGVVEVAANESWRAESSSSWITIDPSRGNAGDFRMYLNFDSNPYRLPRVGIVDVICGDKSGTVTVTQAGCSDNSKVALSTADVEVESLDYASTEIPFSTFAAEIEGNLGLSLAEFSKGIGDEGDLEFFMVNKDGQWVEGGTAGSRCSAWLDYELNVTGWNGDGYPANAAFIEAYGGEDEDPVLVIGRAPGLPDDTEYTLNFGFTFADDHSKFTLFKINVVYPAMDLNGEIVGTIDLNVDMGPVGYDPILVPFHADEVCGLLGCNNPTLCKVVSYDADGEFIPFSANNGYWFDKQGSVGSWGEDAGWFIEYHGGDEESSDEENESWAIGTFPGVTDITGTSHIGLWYNARVVMFNVNISVTGAVPEEE